jgi:hypothetical protein
MFMMVVWSIVSYIVWPHRTIRELTIGIKLQARPDPTGEPRDVSRITEGVTKDNHVLENHWMTFLDL